jgi:hypothetical protein
MHDVVKERKWWHLFTSARVVPLVAVSCLPLHAVDGHSHSITGPGEGRALQVLGQTITSRSPSRSR